MTRTIEPLYSSSFSLFKRKTTLKEKKKKKKKLVLAKQIISKKMSVGPTIQPPKRKKFKHHYLPRLTPWHSIIVLIQPKII